MDIPSMSVNLSTADVQSTWGVKMLAKQLDTVKQSGDQMIQMMEKSVTPELGQNIDVRV